MFARTLYVQVRENQFEVRNLDRGLTIRRQATPGFSHPRMLVGNFTLAQQCLKDAVHDVRGGGFALTTSVLIHPCENIDGGLSQVEERLFHELAIGAGASQVRVWLGAPLNDAEVIERLKAD